MPSNSGSVFSETLQTITTTKLQELAKQRDSFEQDYATLLTTAKTEPSLLKRVCILQDGVKSCLGFTTRNSSPAIPYASVASVGAHNVRLDTNLKNLDRFLEQARFDPSVSPKVLGEWEATLLRYLEVQSTRFQYADLYGKLVTEWLSPEKKVSTDNDVEMSESFEELPGAKRLAARAKWEKDVFERVDVDVEGLQSYLNQLFDMSTKAGAAAIHTLIHDKVQAFEHGLGQPSQFTTWSLRSTIQTLKKSDLLSNEKREALEDFLSNNVILSELADILNLRMTALDRWSWGDCVVVEQRRMLNGNFSIHFDPDLLQAIFLHYIGTKWSVFFKETLQTVLDHDIWKKPHADVSKANRMRRGFFLGKRGLAKNNSLQNKRVRIHRNRYFAHQLLDFAEQAVERQDGEEEAEFGDYVQKTSQVKALFASSSAAKKPRRDVREECEEEDDGDDDDMGFCLYLDEDEIEKREESDEEADDDDYRRSSKRPMETKQKLLHLVSTEIIVNRRLHEDFTCFRTGFESWNPLLPHDTIMTILKFFGFSAKWMKFFIKFLQAPLRFADEDGSEPRLRQCGIPAAHVLSDVLAEVVFFCLDFSVNKATNGATLHRLYDDVWFWDKDYSKCAEAWSKILEFKQVMNVSLDEKKTGSIRVAKDPNLTIDNRLPGGQIRWGFLVLDPKTGRFEIDENMVNGHVKELQRQLDGKPRSVIDWIQAWNSYAATFFSSNFGQASNCFGREHVDKMLATHRHIQESIFQGGNVVSYLKQMIEDRFSVKNIPDGFLFFPVELGGLELKSPFVDLLQIREYVVDDPYKLLDDFIEQEQEDYNKAKHKFDKGEAKPFRSESSVPDWRPDDADIFFSFEEFTKYREEFSRLSQANLRQTYSKLLQQPREKPIDATNETNLYLQGLNGHTNLRGILANWNSMDSYWKWVAQMYGPEMGEKFGGFSVVDFGLLPIGMVSMFRRRRTKWQG